MAVTAKFQADFASFYAAVQKADVHLKGLETGAGKVEASLNRMVDSFSGRKLIQDANLVAEAVQRIGGVSKLTEAEQVKVNARVSEALAKYKALGLDAPPALHKIVRETKDAADAAGRASAGAVNWKNALVSAAGALGIAFSVGAIRNWVGTVVESASRVDDLSKKLGVSAEAVQRWEYAAKQSGSTIDDVDRAVATMNRTLGEGDKSTIAALRLVGLEFTAIRNLKPEDAFNAIVTALAGVEDPMTRARVAVELFGKSGQTLLPAISENIVKTGDAIKVMSDHTVKRLADAEDAWQRLRDKAVVVSGEMVAVIVKSTDSWSAFGRAVATALNPGSIPQFVAQMKAADAEAAKLAEGQKARAEEARQAAVKAGLAEEARQKARAKAEQDAEAAAKKAAAESEQRAKQLAALQDKLFGRDLIARAAEYAKALGGVDNISKLTAESKAELNKVMGAAYERLVLLGKGASETTAQYRMLRDLTVDWAKINAQLAAMPDPFAAITKERQLKFRETQIAILNENQGLTENAQFWAHAGEIADAAMAKAQKAVTDVAPAAQQSAQSISNSFNNTWIAVANGAASMVSQVERTLAALRQTDAYKAAGIFVGRGFGTAEEINRMALKSTSLPMFDRGGPVLKDGPIYAHAGEYVVPKGGSMSGSTFNIYVSANTKAEGQAAGDGVVAALKAKGVRI